MMQSESPNIEAKMREQIALAGRVFGVNVESPFKSDLTRCDYGSEIRDIKTADGHELRINMQTGLIVRYQNRLELPGIYKEDPAGMISKEQALDIGQRLLKALHLDIPIDESMAHYRDDNPNGPYSKFWNFGTPLRYEGIKCFPGSLSIRIRAKSGEIYTFMHLPICRVPDSLEERISSDEAVAIVTDFFNKRNRGSLRTMSLRREPEKVITAANNCWKESFQGPIIPEGNPRLCWLVSPDGGYLVYVFVDAVTGEVCGGIR